MFSIIPVVAFSIFAAGSVRGHGFVHDVIIQGKNYSGYLPFTDPYASPIPSRIVRHVPDDGPVTDVKDQSLACNVGGESGTSLVADAPAGSQVTFNWGNWPSDHLGPVSTYMTSCNGDCTKFDASSAKWFKIDAAGYDFQNKQWASAKLIADKASWTSTIPSSLAPGQYLMRHEIVALHSVGQPQFYPMCAQVKVTGSGNQSPSGSDLVAIPGLYDNTQWPDIWSGFSSFTIPGPAVAFSSGSGSSQPSSAAASSIKGSSTPSASASSSQVSATAHNLSPSSSPASPSTGKCRSQRRTVKRRAHFGRRQH